MDWSAFSLRDKAVLALILVGVGMLLFWQLRLTQSNGSLNGAGGECADVRRAFEESNASIAAATALPQAQRCKAYNDRLWLLNKATSKWVFCLSNGVKGDTRGQNLSAEQTFYERLTRENCGTDVK